MSETPAVYLTDRPDETGDIDNLDKDFPIPSFQGPGGEMQPAIIQDEMAAERHLKAISWYQHEAKYVRDHAAAHRARIDTWEQARLRPMLGRIVWHEEGLRAFLTRSGKRALKLAYGSLRFTGGGENDLSLEVLDETVALAWAKEHGRVGVYYSSEVVEKIKKVPIKNWIRENGGEVPPGTDLKQGEKKFKVEVA